jgi:hypothetical protein
MFHEIKASLQQLYLEDQRPWLVGFSGGKDSTMLASLIFDAVLAIPAERRKKPISVLCTDTRVEIPAIAEMIEGTLRRCRKCSEQHNLNIDANDVISLAGMIAQRRNVFELQVLPGHWGLPDSLSNQYPRFWRSCCRAGRLRKHGSNQSPDWWW